MPGHTTIRSWILRLGLYALTRPLDRSQPWVWLVDHSIQIGSTKLLVILGCPASQLPFGERALAMSDLSLVALVPMEQSNGDVVERELEVAALRTGRPAQIASDQGSDLLKGIADYRALRSEIAHVPDIAHYGANVLEHAWEDDPRWSEFAANLQTPFVYEPDDIAEDVRGQLLRDFGPKAFAEGGQLTLQVPWALNRSRGDFLPELAGQAGAA